MESRTIQHYGIDFENLKYNSDELAMIRRMHKESVMIKYDPNDISKIYVLDPKTKQFITVPCTDLPYARKTLFQHQLIKKFIRKENKKIDVTNLMRAEQRIIEIIDNERMLTKKVRRASKQARYKDVSQKSQYVQTLPNQRPDPRSSDNHSLLSDDEFDPYLIEETDNIERVPFIIDNDDDLEDLYADDPEWHADYSRKDQ
jgi:putative transposase